MREFQRGKFAKNVADRMAGCRSTITSRWVTQGSRLEVNIDGQVILTMRIGIHLIIDFRLSDELAAHKNPAGHRLIEGAQTLFHQAFSAEARQLISLNDITPQPDSTPAP